MNLFILRHGKAGQSSDASDGIARVLTDEGRKEIRKVARWMRSKKIRFEVIATSPLARARQTADIVAGSLGQKDRLEVWEDLAPGGDPDTLCYHAAQYGDDASVLLIGHEPSLSILISRIISGYDTVAIVLTNGGLVKIRNYSFDKLPSGTLQWLLAPGQMRERR
jgi:phosphohistidine phosphatase